MKYLKYIILSIVLFIPSLVLAADYDLAVSSGDISFSENLLIAGSTVRIYATVHNVGTQDMRGYITFFQGSAVIDDSQILAIRPGNKSDAWVDFVVPNSEFNILARIQGTSPADQNSDNDQALTALIRPDIDTDKDGIANAIDPDDDNDGLTDIQEQTMGTDPLKADTDNDGADDKADAFPLNASEKLDTDGDGIGNNADPDDDNDTVSDIDEDIKGTDPLNADTDGDGVNDKEDNYPLDDTRWEIVRDIFKPIEESAGNNTELVNKDESLLDIINDEVDKMKGDEGDDLIKQSATLTVNTLDNNSNSSQKEQWLELITNWWFWLLFSGIIVLLIAVYYIYIVLVNRKIVNGNNMAGPVVHKPEIRKNKQPAVLDLRKINKK